MYDEEGTTIESALARTEGLGGSTVGGASVAFVALTPRVLFQGAISADSFSIAASFEDERPLREVRAAPKERGLGGAAAPPATVRCGLGAEIVPIFVGLPLLVCPS